MNNMNSHLPFPYHNSSQPQYYIHSQRQSFGEPPAFSQYHSEENPPETYNGRAMGIAAMAKRLSNKVNSIAETNKGKHIRGAECDNNNYLTSDTSVTN